MFRHVAPSADLIAMARRKDELVLIERLRIEMMPVDTERAETKMAEFA